MKTFDSATATYLDRRGDYILRHLVWIVAKNRDTGEPETMGLWTGGDNRLFTVEAASRTYFGGVTVLEVPPIEGGVGLEVRQITLSLSGLDPAVLNLVRAYDVRRAPIEIHRVWLTLDARDPVGPPQRIWRGAENGTGIDLTGGTISVRFVSDADRLTRGTPIYKSAAALQARAPTDTFRAYADVAAAVRVPWGEVLASASTVTAAPRTPAVFNESPNR